MGGYRFGSSKCCQLSVVRRQLVFGFWSLVLDLVPGSQCLLRTEHPRTKDQRPKTKDQKPKHHFLIGIVLSKSRLSSNTFTGWLSSGERAYQIRQRFK